jgi:hypothetical protein
MKTSKAGAVWGMWSWVRDVPSLALQARLGARWFEAVSWQLTIWAEGLDEKREVLR